MTMTDIEKYMADKAIIQITFIPTQVVLGDIMPAQYSVVIGNNRYFGFTIAEAVEKAQ
jgi:hypothetical protein